MTTPNKSDLKTAEEITQFLEIAFSVAGIKFFHHAGRIEEIISRHFAAEREEVLRVVRDAINALMNSCLCSICDDCQKRNNKALTQLQNLKDKLTK